MTFLCWSFVFFILIVPHRIFPLSPRPRSTEETGITCSPLSYCQPSTLQACPLCHAEPRLSGILGLWTVDTSGYKEPSSLLIWIINSEPMSDWRIARAPKSRKMSPSWNVPRQFQGGFANYEQFQRKQSKLLTLCLNCNSHMICITTITINKSLQKD